MPAILWKLTVLLAAVQLAAAIVTVLAGDRDLWVLRTVGYLCFMVVFLLVSRDLYRRSRL